MSALTFVKRRRGTVLHKCDCLIPGTARDPHARSCGRSGAFEVQILGWPAGRVCSQHMLALQEAWDDAYAADYVRERTAVPA